MIVVAIIGILAAVAIPAYQDYTGRAQVAEAVELLSGGKTPLSEYYADKGVWPASPASVMGNVGPGKYVSLITFSTPNAGGTITLTAVMKNTGVNANVKGMSIAMITQNGGKAWDCTVASPALSTANNILPKYRPAACR